MRIDRTHRPWIAASVLVLVIGTIIYIPYALSTPGPRGGSAIGLTYGISGYALMLFAGLLGARKKLRSWRMGRAQTWMRGHLWLGLVSLPLILFHGGFAWRGPLTLVLMILFFIVIASGIFGAVVQHYVPSTMMRQVPMETIYEEIPHIRVKLLEQAKELVRVEREAPLREERVRLHSFYETKIEPFLKDPDREDVEVATRERSTEIFASLRRRYPTPLHEMISRLEIICEEERELKRQVRLYRLLHTWLIVHAPLSIVLLLLAGIHAVVALRY